MDAKKNDTTPEDFSISPHSMRIAEFLKMDAEGIAAKTVDCPTCPVAMLCQAGDGGSERVCQTCGATAVAIDVEDAREAAHVYLIECGKHGFQNQRQGWTCNLCDGRIMQHEIRDPALRPETHYLRTVYAKVTAEKRQTDWVKAEKQFRTEQMETVK